MKCARHPDIETNLRCGKCGKPICPKCVVQTPVGARCSDCAAVKRLPVYSVPTAYYARAAAAGLAAGSALGAVWPFIPLGGFFWLIIAAGIGYAIGEVISLAVNRKRGPGLQVIAAMSMVTSYLVRTAIEAPPTAFVNTLFSVYGLIALALGIIVAVSTLRRN
jgi:hypothetical protein